MDFPYEVFNPAGQKIMVAPENCRYPSHIELDMLEPDTLSGSMVRKSPKRN